MKFSTKAITEVSNLLVAELEKALKQEKEIGLDQFEQELRASLQAIGQRALGEMLSLQDEHNFGRVERCTCGGKARRISRRKAKLLSVFGWVDYQRGYYHCERCGRRMALLDEDQGISAGQAGRNMAKLMTMAGITVSFEEASKQLEEYLLVAVSPNTIRKETLAAGERQKEIEAQQEQYSQKRAALQQREKTLRSENAPQRMYGSMDGAHAPTEKGWRELKTLCWYQTEIVYGTGEHCATQIRYRSDIAPAAEFGKLLWASGVEYLADKAEELIFVCDGAAWIWKLVDHYFPNAVQIVDWYHACQYLYPIAEAVFGAQSKQAEAWITETEDLLWQGKIKQVIAACHQYHQHPAAHKPVADALSYFSNNVNRMKYADFREHGYYIGSGTIESACKQIVSLRLKRAGARWTEHGAVATAKARAAWLSGPQHWDALFELPLAA